MRILVIVHDVGKTASGIVSQRIIDELLIQGFDIKVLASNFTKSYPQGIAYCISPFCKIPKLLRRIIFKLCSILAIDSFNSNFLWRIRTYAKSQVILKKWKPDFVYCRTSPIDSCFVGIRIKNKYKIPLVCNLTDPLPAPIEYLPEGVIRNRRIKAAKLIINHSDLISMGTIEAMNYQQSVVGMNFSSKTFISPDSTPLGSITRVPVSSGRNIELLYLGAIYGSRNVHPLIEAVKLMRREGYPLLLRICGTIQSKIREDFVLIESSVLDVNPKLANADILVDIDGDDMVPVFVSSKLKQYIVVDKPILSITPFNSPSYKLLKDLCTVKTVRNKVDDIYEALQYLINESEHFDYSERNAIISNYSVSKIVSDIIHNVNDYLCYRNNI